MASEQLRLRDLAIDRLEAKHCALIAIALGYAVAHARRMGSVTSVEVWRLLELDPRAPALVAQADPRWMGAVFRAKMWRRVGWEASGSHGRPVARWSLVEGSDGT